jgi:hypothetical protein
MARLLLARRPRILTSPATLRWKSGLVSRESNIHCILVRLGASLDQTHDDIFLAMSDQCKIHQVSIRDVARLGPRKTIGQFEAIWATLVESSVYENRDPGRLFRYPAHAQVFQQNRGPPRYDLERPR